MSDENVEFETVELEYSEDDILYYIVDENDEEIGFAIMEDGKEVEYYYVDEEIDVAAEEDAAAASANEDAEPAEAPAAGKTDAKGGDDSDPLFTAEEISEFKDDMVGLLKEVWPFIVGDLVVLFIISAFPEIVLALPRLFGMVK